MEMSLFGNHNIVTSQPQGGSRPEVMITLFMHCHEGVLI